MMADGRAAKMITDSLPSDLKIVSLILVYGSATS
jgi:hypothetical protein